MTRFSRHQSHPTFLDQAAVPDFSTYIVKQHYAVPMLRCFHPWQHAPLSACMLPQHTELSQCSWNCLFSTSTLIRFHTCSRAPTCPPTNGPARQANGCRGRCWKAGAHRSASQLGREQRGMHTRVQSRGERMLVSCTTKRGALQATRRAASLCPVHSRVTNCRNNSLVHTSSLGMQARSQLNGSWASLMKIRQQA